MSCRGSLEYTCPSHGGWGMVRIGMLIPECHQLFVCPSACGRHGALGAIEQGFKQRLSYLYLEESDIISGYDNAIHEAAAEVLERLPKRPKVFLVFVSCLDDLIGTDCDAVIDELSMRYPDIQFRMGHMNPIANNSDEPPLVSTWKNVYSLMERNAETPNTAINMIGNYVPVHKDSEIYEIMNVLGITVKHIGNCETYEELRNMGNSLLNLVVSTPVEKVAKLLKRTQGLDYMIGYVTYDLKEIKENYRVLLEKILEIEKNIFDETLQRKEAVSHEKMLTEQKRLIIEAILNRRERDALQSIKEAKEKIGDRKIYIDYSAFGKPLEAAKFFHDHGFNIQRVYVKDMEEDSEIYQWILKETDIEIIKVNHHNTVNKWESRDESISIGMEAAYISGSRHVVPVFQNEGMYGFHSICLLMEKLCDSIKETADIREVIKRAGLVV